MFLENGVNFSNILGVDGSELIGLALPGWFTFFSGWNITVQILLFSRLKKKLVEVEYCRILLNKISDGRFLYAAYAYWFLGFGVFDFLASFTKQNYNKIFYFLG